MNFWEAKKIELQKEGKLPSARPEPVKAGPWWMEGMSVPGVTQPPQVSAPDTSGPQMTAELERNAQRAQQKQRVSGSCPNCDSGNYVSPADSRYGSRCFDCGYTGGRTTNDLDTFSVSASDTPTLKVKQTASSQGPRLGKTVAEINQANYALEQSAIGR